MVGEVIAGLSAFKSMFDLAKGLKDINDVTTRNSVAIELQEKILTAQAQQAALIERVSDLEKEVASFKTWETEKQRYQLTDFGGGTFAYLMKPDMSNGEPSHRLCAPCYQSGHKSILHFMYITNRQQEKYSCPACKTEFMFGAPGSPPQRRAITRSSIWGRD